MTLWLESVSPGELPPPAPKDFFGRNEIVEKIIGRAERLQSFALIDAGGIGKTSIALTVLDHDRIKKRFGDDRRFIPCDKFPPSRDNFLARLSKAIGAEVEHPEDLTSLRPALLSKDMFIILDNAESILDPHGTDARGVRATVKELSNFSNICLGITSRIATVPPQCKRLEIPTLSMEAARDIFYSIYDGGEQPNIVDHLLQSLDLHALSIILLATTAFDNLWDLDRLAKEWDEDHMQALRTDDESLAATIELSLKSPTFSKLGPNARDLLEVVAFFPQGVDEKNLDWLFPTILDRRTLFDKFCVLSLAYRSTSFITMLAPIREYLRPQDPRSSPFLRMAKDRYFARLSVNLSLGQPGFREAEWIKSEDVNVEHMLDVFTSIGAGGFDVWGPCARFMEHLYWHKPRQTVLQSKIKDLPDDHPSKPRCLFELSRLARSVGNPTEQKQLLAQALTLEKERGDDPRVALTLVALSEANVALGLNEEGVEQAEEALEVYKRLGDMAGQAERLVNLASCFFFNNQFKAAEDTVLSAFDFLTENGQDHLLWKSHCILGGVDYHRGERGKAVDHFQTALGIVHRSNWPGALFEIHYAMGLFFYRQGEIDDASAHIERAKFYAAGNAHGLGHAMEMQAEIWFLQRRLEDARSEGLRAIETYEKLGAADHASGCRSFLERVEREMGSRSISSDSD